MVYEECVFGFQDKEFRSVQIQRFISYLGGRSGPWPIASCGTQVAEGIEALFFPFPLNEGGQEKVAAGRVLSENAI